MDMALEQGGLDQ